MRAARGACRPGLPPRRAGVPAHGVWACVGSHVRAHAWQEAEFPLFMRIHEIAFEGKPVSSIIDL